MEKYEFYNYGDDINIVTPKSDIEKKLTQVENKTNKVSSNVTANTKLDKTQENEIKANSKKISQLSASTASAIHALEEKIITSGGTYIPYDTIVEVDSMKAYFMEDNSFIVMDYDDGSDKIASVFSPMLMGFSGLTGDDNSIIYTHMFDPNEGLVVELSLVEENETFVKGNIVYDLEKLMPMSVTEINSNTTSERTKLYLLGVENSDYSNPFAFKKGKKDDKCGELYNDGKTKSIASQGNFVLCETKGTMDNWIKFINGGMVDAYNTISKNTSWSNWIHSNGLMVLSDNRHSVSLGQVHPNNMHMPAISFDTCIGEKDGSAVANMTSIFVDSTSKDELVFKTRKASLSSETSTYSTVKLPFIEDKDGIERYIATYNCKDVGGYIPYYAKSGSTYILEGGDTYFSLPSHDGNSNLTICGQNLAIEDSRGIVNFSTYGFMAANVKDYESGMSEEPETFSYVQLEKMHDDDPNYPSCVKHYNKKKVGESSVTGKTMLENTIDISGNEINIKSHKEVTDVDGNTTVAKDNSCFMGFSFSGMVEIGDDYAFIVSNKEVGVDGKNPSIYLLRNETVDGLVLKYLATEAYVDKLEAKVDAMQDVIDDLTSRLTALENA